MKVFCILLFCSSLAHASRIGLLPFFPVSHEEREISSLQKRLEEKLGVPVETLLDSFLPYQLKFESDWEELQKRAEDSETYLNRFLEFRKTYGEVLELQMRWRDLEASLRRKGNSLEASPDRYPFPPDVMKDEWDSEAGEGGRTTCLIHFQGKVPTTLSVNGFATVATKSLSLVAGRRYQIDFDGRRARFSCEEGAPVVLSTKDAGFGSKEFPSETLLVALKTEKKWDSVLVAKKKADEYSIWSFSDENGYQRLGRWKPGQDRFGVDDISGLKLSETRRDAFADPTHSFPPVAETDAGKAKSSWYNDWKLWTLGGGLLVGAATFFVLSNGGEPSGWKVNME